MHDLRNGKKRKRKKECLLHLKRDSPRKKDTLRDELSLDLNALLNEKKEMHTICRTKK